MECVRKNALYAEDVHAFSESSAGLLIFTRFSTMVQEGETGEGKEEK